MGRFAGEGWGLGQKSSAQPSRRDPGATVRVQNISIHTTVATVAPAVATALAGAWAGKGIDAKKENKQTQGVAGATLKIYSVRPLPDLLLCYS